MAHITISNTPSTRINTIAKDNQSSIESSSSRMTNILYEQRILFINATIDMQSAQQFCKELLYLDSINHKPICVMINSPGGEINSGFLIFDTIQYVTSNVVIIGAGLVASAAALIYVSVPKKQRFCFSHARFMLHQPLSGMQGVVSDLEIHAKELDELKKIINEIVAKQTGKKTSTVTSDTDRDFWLSATAALDYGLCERIIKKRKDLAPSLHSS